jgi:hypothetical protein
MEARSDHEPAAEHQHERRKNEQDVFYEVEELVDHLWGSYLQHTIPGELVNGRDLWRS